MLGKLISDLLTEKVYLGQVESEVLNELDQIDNEAKLIRKTMETKMDDMVETFKKQIGDEFKGKLDELKTRNETIWNQIYDQLGLDNSEREHEHSVERTTGKVYRKQLKKGVECGCPDCTSPKH